MQRKRVFNLLSGLFLAAGFIVFGAGCSTMIPESDTSQPEITLTITGPGIGTKRMTNPPNGLWAGPGGSQLFDMFRGTTYNFTLSVSDQGGAAYASFDFPREFTVIEISPADVRTSTDALFTTLSLLGDRDDPRTGLVISGRFRTPDLDPSSGTLVDFRTEGRDFGGRSGTSPNVRFMQVNASVGVPF